MPVGEHLATIVCVVVHGCADINGRRVVLRSVAFGRRTAGHLFPVSLPATITLYLRTTRDTRIPPRHPRSQSDTRRFPDNQSPSVGKSTLDTPVCHRGGHRIGFRELAPRPVAVNRFFGFTFKVHEIDHNDHGNTSYKQEFGFVDCYPFNLFTFYKKKQHIIFYKKYTTAGA